MTVRLRGAPLASHRGAAAQQSWRAEQPLSGGSATSSSGKQIGSLEASFASPSGGSGSPSQRQLSPARRALLQERLTTGRTIPTARSPNGEQRFRPLSVVPQVPRLKANPMSGVLEEETSLDIKPRDIRWADAARDRAVLEHEEAKLELELIAQMNESFPLVLPIREPPPRFDPQDQEGRQSRGSSPTAGLMCDASPGGRVAFADDATQSPRTATAVEELRAHLVSRGQSVAEIDALFKALSGSANGNVSAADLQDGLRRARANEAAFAPLLAIADELNGILPSSPKKLAANADAAGTRAVAPKAKRSPGSPTKGSPSHRRADSVPTQDDAQVTAR